MGRDACLALANLGARVVIGNRSEQSGRQIVQEIQEIGGQSVFQPTNVADANDCKNLIDRALREFGRVDMAFNNAGIQREFNNVHETPDEDFSDIIDTNLKGILYMMKYETLAMLETGGGAIVNNASIFGLKAMPGAAYYVASKHGIIGATRAAALDYAQDNIRINAICPGPIKTPSFDRVTNGDEHLYDDGVPMHRIGQSEEVTDSVIWLLSQKSSFITGAHLSIDGGMSSQ